MQRAPYRRFTWGIDMANLSFKPLAFKPLAFKPLAFRALGAADDEFSPYAILDENLNAICDLLGNVIEEEY